MVTLDVLQIKARQLESEINYKLICLETIVAETRPTEYKSKNTSAFNNSFHSILVEIEELLSELDAVNAKLSETTLVEVDNELESIHSLQGHRQVLDDLKQVFYKIREKCLVKRESERIEISSDEALDTAINIRECSLKQVQGHVNSLSGTLRINCYKCWNLMFLALVTAGCISFMFLYKSW